MRTIGFAFSTTHLRCVVFDGDIGSPAFVDKVKLSIPADHSVPQCAVWLEMQIGQIIHRFEPDKVGYKLDYQATSYKMIYTTFAAVTILNLLAEKGTIFVEGFTAQSIKSSKFGVKTDKSLQKIPDWDASMRDAAAVSLLLMRT